MKQILPDVNHECLVCSVPKECRPGHNLCGVSKGMRLGIYPKHSHTHPSTGLPSGMGSGKCGFPEKPLFMPGDGMTEFVEKLAKLDERKLFSQ